MQKPAPKTQQPPSFGEVIQTDIAAAVVQVWPQTASVAGNFGQIIKISCPWGNAYGVVVSIKTTPLLGHLQPMALQLDPQELALEQPQLNDVVANFITANMLVYTTNSSAGFIFNYPPQPAPLHAFAAALTHQELDALSQHPLFWPHFLQLIQSTGIAERLLKALVFTLAEHQPLPVSFFENLYNHLCQTPGFTQPQIRQLFREFSTLARQNT